jgi:hypothetical protein
LLFVPPRKSSEPEVANLKPKIAEVNTPSEMRVWNTGGALNLDKDGYARPISPSGGKLSMSKPEVMIVAPRVCDSA